MALSCRVWHQICLFLFLLYFKRLYPILLPPPPSLLFFFLEKKTNGARNVHKCISQALRHDNTLLKERIEAQREPDDAHHRCRQELQDAQSLVRKLQEEIQVLRTAGLAECSFLLYVHMNSLVLLLLPVLLLFPLLLFLLLLFLSSVLLEANVTEELRHLQLQASRIQATATASVKLAEDNTALRTQVANLTETVDNLQQVNHSKN